jgi:transposase-like protein
MESRYLMSVTAWRHHWDGLPTFLSVSGRVAQTFYTNSIESLHSQMRKNISNRKVFPTIQSVIKIR